MSERPEWLASKRFGYGAGLPVAWQGWALLLGYLAEPFLLPPAAGSLLIYSASSPC
jgi:hypothetical protein